MGTMLLGGLWHGASWTFVAWGGLHGLYLSAERWLRARFAGYVPGPLALLALGLLTWTLVNITWVFFRAKGFEKAGFVLQGMFGLVGDAKPILPMAHLVTVAVIVAGILVTHSLMRRTTLEGALARTPALVLSLAWGLMLFAIVAAQGVGNAFIYFQF
jgi:alginate O-acetyltransferase complex protein AlgI